jgi:molybdenum cofactor cytidylyltransferase
MRRMYDSRRMVHDIWAIILAAGESKRMGVPKMLLQFEGITMIERVMNNVKMSEVDNAVVVLGSERNKIVELVEKTSFSHCYNVNFKDGM